MPLVLQGVGLDLSSIGPLVRQPLDMGWINREKKMKDLDRNWSGDLAVIIADQKIVVVSVERLLCGRYLAVHSIARAQYDATREAASRERAKFFIWPRELRGIMGSGVC